MSAHAPPEPAAPADLLTGTLHVYVAFDWGDEINLERARRLVPAEVHALSRRPRTPPSIAYRPPPLRFRLAAAPLVLPAEVGPVEAAAEATVFDFGAVSVALHVPFRLPRAGLVRLAGWLAEPADVHKAARAAVLPLHQKLLPAVQDPHWSEELSEEYFVFHLPPGNPLPPALTAASAGWLAGLVRLEDGPLSPEEVREALRLHLRYSPDDLFIPDWAAAVLFDAEPGCNETLQVIEFANLQLLEYRHIDERLDASTAAAYRLAHQAGRSRLPLWHSHDRPLRLLGELKVEANDLFERTGNALKLVGDQYLARVYDLLGRRFHLREWEGGIRRKLDVAEGVYRVIADQSADRRMEFLEVIIIVLIALEIVLSFFRH